MLLFVDVFTRNRRTFLANPQALLANGFEVGVIDRPREKQIPGVMGRRLGPKSSPRAISTSLVVHRACTFAV